MTVLAGCTGLNGAFDDRQDPVGTGGATTAQTSSAVTNPTGPPSPTASGSGVTSAGNTTTDSPPPTTVGQTGSTGTGTSGTSGERSSSGSTAGDSEVLDAATGGDTRVVFIYAVDGWMAPGNYPPASTSGEYCTDNAASLCESDGVALLRQPDIALADVLGPLDAMWFGLPVFGAGSKGDTALADSPLGLLTGPAIRLLDGGVEDPSETGLFFSGGSAKVFDTCEGWSDPFSTAIAGSFEQAGPTWFSDTIDVPCADHLPILCACLSGPDPFE